MGPKEPWLTQIFAGACVKEVAIITTAVIHKMYFFINSNIPESLLLPNIDFPILVNMSYQQKE